MKITKQMLLDKEACSDQIELFDSLFGEEAKVTKANVLKAYEAGIDFYWAANNLLSPPQYKTYEAIKQPALEAYKVIKKPAYETYSAVQKPAWEAYKAIEQPALEAYKAIEQPAWEAYKAIEQPAYEAYKKQCALAFYEACKTP